MPLGCENLRAALLAGPSIALLLAAMTGNATALWPPTGVPVELHDGARPLDILAMIEDGDDGFIALWWDTRNSPSIEVFVQRLASDGSVLWTRDGVRIPQLGSANSSPQLISDGNHGAVLAWKDASDTVILQRVDATGELLWGSTGIVVPGSTASLPAFALELGESGDILVAWAEHVFGPPAGYRATVQRFDLTGAAQWAGVGVPCSITVDSIGSIALEEFDGDTWVLWTDDRDPAGYEVFDSRVSPSGELLHAQLSHSALGQQPSNLRLVDSSSRLWATWTDARGLVVESLSDLTGTIFNAMPTDYEIAPDETGGLFAAWGGQDLYAAHLDSSGNADWGASGVAVCAAAGTQTGVKLATDISGGLMLSWLDGRVDDSCYIQYLDASGVPSLPLDGLLAVADTAPFGLIESTSGEFRLGVAYVDFVDDPVRVHRLNTSGLLSGWSSLMWIKARQDRPVSVADGAGGAYVVWRDLAQGFGDETIWAQRVDANGTLIWSESTNILKWPGKLSSSIPPFTAASDGVGGLLVAWVDERAGNDDIFAQRVDEFGNLLWTSAGVAACSQASLQGGVSIVEDGVGGAYLTWEDNRSVGELKAYGQHIDASGNPAWTPDGVPLFNSNDDETVFLSPDGSGGALVSTGGLGHLLVQRFDASGNEQWTAGGVAVVPSSSAVGRVRQLPDGQGGLLVGWEDNRTGPRGIFAQHIDAFGNALWTAGGVEVVPGSTEESYLLEDVLPLSGGVAVVWGARPPLTPVSASSYRAQKLSMSAVPQWGTNGIQIAPENLLGVSTDGDGGLLSAWLVFGLDGSFLDDYYFAQRIDSSGNALGPSGGLNFCRQNGGNIGGWTVLETGRGLATWSQSSGLFTGIDGLGEFAVVARADLTAACDVTPSQVDVGTVILSDSTEVELTIRNTGNIHLEGNASVDCLGWRLGAGEGAFSIPPGDSLVVAVRFVPSTPGNSLCSLELQIPECGSIPLSGIGRDCATIVYHVNAAAAPDGDGITWATAFADIQTALAAVDTTSACGGAVPYVEIWVAAGSYVPTQETGNSAREESFVLRDGSGLFGSFSGSETARAERDPMVNPTILSGEINQPGAIDNSYHVVWADNADSTTVVDGFTIRDGYADGNGTRENGAGMALILSRTRLSNLRIEGNVANYRGGGCYVLGGAPRLENVAFVQNSALDGGGIHADQNPALTISGALFFANEAELGGGAYIISDQPSRISSASFHANTAIFDGGAMWVDVGAPGAVLIQNTISWGNLADQPDRAELYFDVGSDDPVIEHSLLAGCNGSGPTWNTDFGIDLGGNLDADPLFASSGTGDLQLLAGSPAIDAGDASAPGLPLLDLAGQPRVSGVELDMGAFEFIDPATGIGDEGFPGLAVISGIQTIGPNPFNPRLRIRYATQVDGPVALKIFDSRGRLVRLLDLGEQSAGVYEVYWDGTSDAGQSAASGVYFVQFASGQLVQTRKVSLVK